MTNPKNRKTPTARNPRGNWVPRVISCRYLRSVSPTINPLSCETLPFYHSFRWRAAYAATLNRFPHSCMLHQRRVPFLLVSWKWSTQLAHLRTRLRSPVARSVATLCAKGASKSAGSRASNHCLVEYVVRFLVCLVSIGCIPINRFSSSRVWLRIARPPSHARISSRHLSRRSCMSPVVF